MTAPKQLPSPLISVALDRAATPQQIVDALYLIVGKTFDAIRARSALILTPYPMSTGGSYISGNKTLPIISLMVELTIATTSDSTPLNIGATAVILSLFGTVSTSTMTIAINSVAGASSFYAYVNSGTLVTESTADLVGAKMRAILYYVYG